MDLSRNGAVNHQRSIRMAFYASESWTTYEMAEDSRRQLAASASSCSQVSDAPTGTATITRLDGSKVTLAYRDTYPLRGFDEVVPAAGATNAADVLFNVRTLNYGTTPMVSSNRCRSK